MAYSDWRAVQDVPIRPLTKGMIRNLPSNALPAGAFQRLKNFKVKDIGLEKRGGILPFHLNDFVATSSAVQNDYLQWDTKIQDVVYFWRPDTLAEALVVTGTQLWELLANNKCGERPLNSIVLNANITTYTITGTTVSIVTNVPRGLWRKGDFASISGTKGRVLDITGSSTMSLVVDFENTPPAKANMTGYHMFQTNDTFSVDWTVTPGYDNKLILTDISARGLYTYNGTTLSIMTILNGESTTPDLVSGKVCAMFADRLWIANTMEGTGSTRYVQRIRWSQPANFTTFRDEDFIDLPYNDGEILKLVPMGSMLVCYCQDSIYFGRQTNYSNLPYAFTPMDTGGMGPVSQRAIQAWTDGHFFVGSDDVYWFNASTSLQPISDPVLKDSLEVSRKANMLKYTEIGHDPLNESLMFLFPDVSVDIFNFSGLATKLWVLNTKTKGWSYYNVPLTSSDIPVFYFSSVTASRFFATDQTWKDWYNREGPEEIDWINTGTATEQWLDKNTWFDLQAGKYLDKTLFYGIRYRRTTPIAASNQWVQGLFYEGVNQFDTLTEGRTYSVATGIESADYDLNAPDTVKTVTRLSMKCWEQPLERLTFDFEVSDDRGLNWKRLPQLRWNPRYDEGRGDFRSTGTNFRFRISSDQETHPYILTEMVLRVAGRGLQTDI